MINSPRKGFLMFFLLFFLLLLWHNKTNLILHRFSEFTNTSKILRPSKSFLRQNQLTRILTPSIHFLLLHNLLIKQNIGRTSLKNSSKTNLSNQLIIALKPILIRSFNIAIIVSRPTRISNMN